MAVAMAEAGKGGKRVFPNPLVGAVILNSQGIVLSSGFHGFCGAPHAEREALGRIDSADGCTMVVTLEPCCHHGRTPPCTEAIIQAGIVRVVVAMKDPDPRMSGKGVRILRENGIEVETGLMESEAEELNSLYLHHLRTGRSFLHLKMAGTLDGRSAAADGSSRWITGPESRRRVHLYRKNAHAVLVGAGTAEKDDPSLTVRSVDCPNDQQPVRIILTDRELSQSLKVFRDGGRTVVASPFHIKVPDFVELWPDIHSLDELLIKTAAEGLGMVFCEGGGTLAASLVKAELVDRLSIFTAPALLGGSGLPLIGNTGSASIDDMIRLKNVTVERTGSDILTEGTIVHRAD